MSEPENFLSRWSRRKRDAETAPEPDAQAKPVSDAAPQDAAAAPQAEEPALDLASLPSLDQIAAHTDISVFMKRGVPAALRHAALRRAWANDPAIRDFRGLQENDWDFNAPDGVPGFGTFKSEDEVKALAQRLFGPDRPEQPEEEQLPQAAPQDSEQAPAEEPAIAAVERPGENPAAAPAELGPDEENASQRDNDAAMQRAVVRRHGGALPQ